MNQRNTSKTSNSNLQVAWTARAPDSLFQWPIKIMPLVPTKIYLASASSQGTLLCFVYQTEEAYHRVNYVAYETAERLKASISGGCSQTLQLSLWLFSPSPPIFHHF